MAYDASKHQRRSIRLPTYDYKKPNAYFVTTFSQHRMCVFGDVEGDKAVLNAAGEVAQDVWRRALPLRFPNVTPDVFVAMPNRPFPTGADTGMDRPALGEVVGAFKSITTHRYIQGVRCDGWPPFNGRLWGRNYHERIVRGKDELNRVRAYIEQNPLNWARDRENR